MLATQPTKRSVRVVKKEGSVLTLPPKPILPRLLSSKLLDGQAGGIQNARQVDVEGGQVGHFVACGTGVVRNPRPLTHARDRIDIVDAAKVGHGLAKGFCLRVPTDHVDVGTTGHLFACPIQLGHQLLGAFQVAVGDKDLDALSVVRTSTPPLQFSAYLCLTSI